MEQVDEPTAQEKILDILRKAAAIHNKDKAAGLMPSIEARQAEGRSGNGPPFSCCAVRSGVCIDITNTQGESDARDPVPCAALIPLARLRTSDDTPPASRQRQRRHAQLCRSPASPASRCAGRTMSMFASAATFSVRAEGPRSDSTSSDRAGRRYAARRTGKPRSAGAAMHDRRVKVYVTMPRMAAATIAGSGDMTSIASRARHSTAARAGSGDLSIATLSVAEAKLSIAGSGNMQPTRARSSNWRSRFAGSGDLDGTLACKRSGAKVSIAGLGRGRRAEVSGAGRRVDGGLGRCRSRPWREVHDHQDRLGRGAVRQADRGLPDRPIASEGRAMKRLLPPADRRRNAARTPPSGGYSSTRSIASASTVRSRCMSTTRGTPGRASSARRLRPTAIDIRVEGQTLTVRAAPAESGVTPARQGDPDRHLSAYDRSARRERRRRRGADR